MSSYKPAPELNGIQAARGLAPTKQQIIEKVKKYTGESITPGRIFPSPCPLCGVTNPKPNDDIAFHVAYGVGPMERQLVWVCKTCVERESGYRHAEEVGQ